jgi:hypothetical protein
MLKITFEFVGGPHDGKTVIGCLGDGTDAERFYVCTNRGRLGQRFKVASDYAVETLTREQLKEDTRHHFQQHFYVVTQRTEAKDGDCVLVRAEYLPRPAENR